MTSRLLTKPASGVLASLRGSTYEPEYASPLRSLRPCWTAFLNSLRGMLLPVETWNPVRVQYRASLCQHAARQPEEPYSKTVHVVVHPRAHTDKGFTLIEVLVAVTLLATIAAIVFGSLISTTRAVDTGREHATKEQRLRQILRLMAEEISLSKKDNAFPWIGMNGMQDGQPADTLAFLAISRGSATVSVKESENVRVVYTRERDRLIRFTRRNLYGLTDESVDQTDLADRVSGFNIRYYDGQSRIWLDEWQTPSPPTALLLEITFQQPDTVPWTVREWITIGGS